MVVQTYLRFGDAQQGLPLAPERFPQYVSLVENDIARVHGVRDFLLQLSVWTAGWVMLFYSISLTYGRWSVALNPSSKRHENDRFWCGRTIVGIVHAIVVAGLAVPCLFMLMSAPLHVQFAWSDNLATCEPDPDDPRLANYHEVGILVAYSGLVFMAFIFADVVISAVHNLSSWDYVLHHVIFLCAAAIIRGHCILPLNAALLLSMEASTPFLNYIMFLRHRPIESIWLNGSLLPIGIGFIVLYVFFRLALAGWGVWLLVEHRDRLLDAAVPEWQIWFLIVAVSAGFTLQVFWFPSILHTFWTKLRGTREGDSANDNAEGAPEADDSSNSDEKQLKD